MTKERQREREGGMGRHRMLNRMEASIHRIQSDKLRLNNFDAKCRSKYKYYFGHCLSF